MSKKNSLQTHIQTNRQEGSMSAAGFYVPVCHLSAICGWFLLTLRLLFHMTKKGCSDKMACLLMCHTQTLTTAKSNSFITDGC